MDAAPETAKTVSQLDEVRRLYHFYAALNQRFTGLPELSQPAANAGESDVETLRQWFAEIDGRIEAHHLRELLQTNLALDADGLIALLARHMASSDKSDAHRDKLDFLLVQCLALAIPPDTQTPDVTCVAEVLAPVLGDSAQFAWMDGLESCIRQLNECRTLQDFMERRIFEQARQFKSTAGEMYFSAPAMLAFTRFNFLLRRGFIFLLQSDLKAIRDVLAQLEAAGVQVIDCSGAGLSSAESPATLRKVCAQRERPFQGKHSDHEWIHQLIAVRHAIAAALDQARRNPPRKPVPAGTKHTSAQPKLAPVPVLTLPQVQAPVIANQRAAAAVVSLQQAREVKLPQPEMPKPAPPELAKTTAAPKPPSATERAALTAKPAVPQPTSPAGTETKSTVPPAKAPVSPKRPAPETAEKPAAEKAPTTKAAIKTGPDLAAELERHEQLIAQQLRSAEAGKSATIRVGRAKVSLPSWEVAAFKAADAHAMTVRRAATIWAMLSDLLVSGAPAEALGKVLQLAHSEIAALEKKAGNSKQAKDPKTAQLAACARSLTTAMEQAEKRARAHGPAKPV